MTRIIFSVIVVGIISVFITGFKTQSTVATQSGVVNPEWYINSNGPVVWGTTSARDAFVIYSYDRELNLLSSYKKSFSGLMVDQVRLFYKDSGVVEFIIQDFKRKKEGFIQLDQDLKEHYYSGVFPLRKLTNRDSIDLKLYVEKGKNVVADFRSQNYYWEVVRIEKVSNHNRATSLVVQQLNFKRNDTLPEYEFDWRVDIAQASGEYFKFLCADSDYVFLYSNFSTTRGEQYIYCLNTKDGSVKYKTRLALKDIQACIYSNHLYDPLSKVLMIGGTCIFSSADTVGYPGMFIVRMDEQGKIISSDIKQGIGFSYPPSADFNGTTIGLPTRNQKTYYRFCEIEELPTGELVNLIDCYSMITVFNGTANSLRFLDNNHHYFMTQCIQYKLNGNTLTPVSGTKELPLMQYQAGINFIGIANYEIQKTHLRDSAYENNINAIADSRLEPNYYVGSAVEKNSGSIKCLLKNSFVSLTGNTDLYFTAGAGKKYFVAFQRPIPVAGQDVLVKSKYLIRDYSTLYRLVISSNGYELSTQIW